MSMIRATLALLLTLTAAQAQVEPERAIALADGTLEVEAGEAWSATVAVPEHTADERPVLALRARLDNGGTGGGCNYVLQVRLGGVPLIETPSRRRLLNKAPWFEPPGTDYHFSWFGLDYQGWMTIFDRDFEGDWGGSGEDYSFVFDLSGLVPDDAPFELSLHHEQPTIAAALNRDRAPLAVDRLRLGVLPAERVAALREQVAAASPPTPVAIDTAPPEGRPAAPPYELADARREVWHEPQVRFGDLAGWTAQLSGRGQVTVAPAIDQRLWSPATARVAYTAGDSHGMLELRPPRPVPLPPNADAADLWLRGDYPRDSSRMMHLYALVTDAADREVAVDLGKVNTRYWFVQHGVVPPDVAARLTPPLAFTGLLLAPGAVDKERVLHLDTLAFYRQQRTPAPVPPRIDPALPVGDAGMAPTPAGDERTTVVAAAGGADFVVSTGAGRLVYRVRVADGPLDGISAQWRGGPEVRPMAGGGVQLPGAGELRYEVMDLQGDRLLATWRRGDIEIVAVYQVRGRTLLVDVVCPGGAATGLDYGVVDGLLDGRGIEVPYLTYGYPFGPTVAAGSGLFASVLPDLHHSDFSAVDARPNNASDGQVALLGGTEYRPLTDGRRNDLRERVMITVSPEFADVLPNHASPPSPNLERLAPSMFIMANSLDGSFWTALRRLGLRDVITSDFARIFVEDYGEGFAMRSRPHPSLSVEFVQAYREKVHALGYLFGAYLDAIDYFPLNEHFHPDRVALTPEGDWVDGWYGNFRLKPQIMPGIVDAVGSEVQRLYPPDCVYLDVHTNLGPWATDYEAGVAGAGVARRQVYGNADAMIVARERYGSTISEGIYRWMYAGACDMDYAQIRSAQPDLADQPLLLDFDLLKLHPYQHGTMMGYAPGTYLSGAEAGPLYADKGADPPESFYRYVAASLAYGHMMLTGYGYLPPPARYVQLYALMQAPQREYLTDTVTAIEYHNGERWLPTSQALLDPACDRRRVRVTYSRGLTAVVNTALGEPWAVEVGDRVVTLPPHGWHITGPDGLVSASTLVDGRRVDTVRAPDMIYHRGPARPDAPVAADGAVWAQREGDGWRILPCGDLGAWQTGPAEGLSSYHQKRTLGALPPNRGCGEIAVDTQVLMNKAPDAVTVTARNVAGEPVAGEVGVREGRLVIVPGGEAFDYWME